MEGLDQANFVFHGNADPEGNETAIRNDDYTTANVETLKNTIVKLEQNKDDKNETVINDAGLMKSAIEGGQLCPEINELDDEISNDIKPKHSRFTFGKPCFLNKQNTEFGRFTDFILVGGGEGGYMLFQSLKVRNKSKRLQSLKF